MSALHHSHLCVQQVLADGKAYPHPLLTASTCSHSACSLTATHSGVFNGHMQMYSCMHTVYSPYSMYMGIQYLHINTHAVCQYTVSACGTVVSGWVKARLAGQCTTVTPHTPTSAQLVNDHKGVGRHILQRIGLFVHGTPPQCR